jgi:hypothetical protein
MHRIGRLSAAAAAIAATWVVPALVTSASATTTVVKPTINSTTASFTIPAGPSQAWVIRLWTLPTPSTLEGQTFGTSGTITVKVPNTQNCQFQVDVKVAPAGTTNVNDFTWYSGITATVAGCGPHCGGGTGKITWPDGTGSHPRPTISATEATFTVPAGTPHSWVLRLWTMPQPSTLEGQVFGTSGTLTLNVPLTSTCEFQVDVKVAPVGTTNPNDFTWYSGIVATV